MAIRAEQLDLHKVFQHSYVIPVYQRPYAWGLEEVETLLDDLLGASSDQNDYFLGSLVLVSNGKRYDVVDGQQRLTTLSILFAALAETTPTLANDLGNYLAEPENRILDIKPRPRVSLRSQDNAFFEKHIVNRFPLESHQNSADLSEVHARLLANFERLRNRLAEVPDKDRVGLVKFMASRCYLVQVQTENLEAAHRIFAVLNNRGMPLEPTDIIKASLLGRMPESDREHYAKAWEGIETELGRDEFVNLFLHIRTILSQEKQRDSLLEEYLGRSGQDRRTGLLDRPDLQPASKFLDAIVTPYAHRYSTILAREYESKIGAEDVNRTLEHLLLYPNRDWVSVVLAWFYRNAGDPALLIRFFRDVDRLSMSLLLRGQYTNVRVERFLQVLKHVERGGDPFIDASPLQLSPEEQSETVAAIGGNVYEGLPKSRLVLLRRLSQVLRESPGALETSDTFTVEHVLPQSPPAGSEWTQWYPDAAERAQWTHRLGNLVLLSRRKNSAAGNRSFAEKRDTYFRKGVTTLALTVDVLATPTFDRDFIVARQQRLVTQLCKEFRLWSPASDLVLGA